MNYWRKKVFRFAFLIVVRVRMFIFFIIKTVFHIGDGYMERDMAGCFLEEFKIYRVIILCYG